MHAVARSTGGLHQAVQRVSSFEIHQSHTTPFAVLNGLAYLASGLSALKLGWTSVVIGSCSP
jgi:hypothetical protein